MDDGTDAEALSSNLEFIFNSGTNNHSIDIEFDISQGEKGLEINGYNPKVEDSESSDDGGIELKQHLREVCGDYSNENIEQFHATNSSRSDNGVTLQEMSKMLQEASLKHVMAQAGLDRTKESTEVSPEDKKAAKKKKKEKRNVAIQSILGIQSNCAIGGTSSTNGPTGVAAGPVAVPVAVACESKAALSKAPVSSGLASGLASGLTSGLTNGIGRGRGRKLLSEKSRHNNKSMIRPECIHGYDANNHYDPNDAKTNAVPSPSDFPPL